MKPPGPSQAVCDFNSSRRTSMRAQPDLGSGSTAATRFLHRLASPLASLWLKVAAGVLLAATMLLAQTFTAGITGTVTDSAGASVAGAAVEIINTGTQETRQASSDAAGLFTVQQLLPGTYSVSVTAPGFKKFIKANITLVGNQTAEVNAQLSVGDTTQSIEVNASALAVDTQTATRDTTLNSEQVLALPTSLRNPLFLVHTTAGVAAVRTGLNPYQT